MNLGASSFHEALNRDGKGAGFEKSLAQLKTLRRVADETVAAKHTHAGIPVSPARSQVEARRRAAI
jgi:hypothetical protein